VTGLLLHILTPARTGERESSVWEKKRGERDASAASRKERKRRGRRRWLGREGMSERGEGYLREGVRVR
jgi:hypothetical protein